MESRLPRLGLIQGTPSQSSLIRDIQNAPLDKLLGSAVQNQSMAEAVKAGLCVGLDAWEEAHAIAQDLDTVEGSYWHGIVHRREPDPGNAKYWFRRVGLHPVLKQLGSQETLEELASLTVFDIIVQSGSWVPGRFIDLCMECERGETPEIKPELQALQKKEIELLLTYCIQNAMGA
ncbi:hypothetical protein [Candidatus Nitronereus thalassa]|uniref:Uncharacterized protein n=1 Tax=Candidatus Nitronereus thalassa TaxID=3020898 RepID=A0ABU3KAU5_9BACT|nr:hypothetical protein [Candidatus Nitronereus thalassa]MDT7043531.1 hypothetical protein [Candidatus Nitronereus thalassa]